MAAFCLGEGGLRLAGYSATSPFEGLLNHNDPLVGYRMVAGERVRLGGPGGEYSVEIVDLGFGDGRGFRDDGRKGPVHSVFFGDSFVWGFGVDLGDAVSERFEAMTGRDAVNLGMTSFTSPLQYARLFAAYGPVLRADIAFFGMFVGNDLEDNVSFDNWLQSAKQVSYPEWCTCVVRGVTGDGAWARVRRFALRNSALWSTVTDRLQGDSHRNCAPFDRDREIALLRKALRQIKETANALGTRPVLFLIPMKELVYPPGLPPGKREAQEDTRYPVMLELLRESGMDLVDLLPAFRKAAVAGAGDLYFETDGHWTPEGHALAAAVLERHLD